MCAIPESESSREMVVDDADIRCKIGKTNYQFVNDSSGLLDIFCRRQ